MPSDVAAVLVEKEAQIRAQLDYLTQPAQDVGSISFGKRVGEGTAMAVDRLSTVRTHEHLTTLLAEVRRAQAKLDDGTYGLCDACGEPIGEPRLEIRPWAVTCVRDG